MPKKETSFALLKRMQAQKLEPYLKRAAEDSKVSFEANFYRLTDAIISEQFPQLKQYDLGFQLIDKSKDNSKAFGIRAFRLKTLVFIPFFYDNGKVTGYELIYMPKQNLIVPASPAWISYLKQKAFEELGEEEVPEEFGDFSTSPNLLPLRRPLTFKVASYLKKLEKISKIDRLVPKALSDPGCSGAFLAFLDKYPFFVEKCASVYGKERFSSMVKQAIESVKSIQNINKTYIPLETQIRNTKIRIYDLFNDTFELSKEEVDQLNKKGYFVKDARTEEEKSKVIQVPAKLNVSLVSSPGLYEIIDSNLNKKTIIVLFENNKKAGPTYLPAIDNAEKYYAYVDNEVPRIFRCTSGPIYYVKQLPNSEFLDTLQKLPKITKNLIVNRKLPKELSDIAKNIPLHGDVFGNILFIGNDGFYSTCDFDSDITLSKGNRIQKYDNILFVPEDTKIALRGEKTSTPSASSSFILDTLKKVACPVKIYFDSNNQYVVNGKRLEKFGVLHHLIMDFGVSEADALKMIKTAELCEQARFFVKKAEDFPVKIYQEERPVVDFSGEITTEFAPGIRAMMPLEVERWVPGLKRPRPLANIMEPPPLAVITTLQRISESNDGEVFDLGLLSGLLHNTRSASVIKELIPEVMHGMDGLGRILFVLYRHKDKFVDLYGKGDYDRLVDQIRNNLEMLGDIVMDIVQQKIDPYIRGFSGAESESGITQVL